MKCISDAHQIRCMKEVRRSIVLFLLGAIASISFNHWYIDDDYIVQFPYADVSTETMAVTAGHPASVEFAAEKDSIYGFNMQLNGFLTENGHSQLYHCVRWLCRREPVSLRMQ